MPIVKVPVSIFGRLDLQKYNTIIMVSGSYGQLNELNKTSLKNWISQGNTLITTKGASAWVINNNIVNEQFITKQIDSTFKRLPYKDSRGTYGKQRIGGAIFKVDLDISHPVAYGYHDKTIPVYKNNSIFIKPSNNPFSTVAAYTKNPHIDGYVTQENIDKYILST